MGEMYHHLSLNDRMTIEKLLRKKMGIKEIAEIIGVHFSTIYRERKKGHCVVTDCLSRDIDDYSATIADEQYREYLRQKGGELKIGTDLEYAEYLEYKVAVEKYSPGAVLGEIEAQGLVFDTKISKTTFYRYIDMGLFLTLTNEDLPVKRNKKKLKYKKVRARKASAGTSIEKRPPEIDDREEFGHWEMDCVVGRQGTRPALLVLTERKTRDELMFLMPDKTAESVRRALDRLEAEMGSKLFTKVFRTITVDNGSEFSDVEALEMSSMVDGKRTMLYYCHPYCSCERGSNENQNRLVRRHYPKGYDFSNTNDADVKRVEKWINNYPREMFGWHTSRELFEREMEAILAA